MKAITIPIFLSHVHNLTGPLTIDNLFVELNKNHVNILHIYKDFPRNNLCITLTHPEFAEVPPGWIIPECTLEEARKRYPFLFIDTNPLLWRKF